MKSKQITKNQPTVMQMSLGKASKIELLRVFSAISLRSIVSADYPTIGQLRNQHGLAKVETATEIVIADLNSVFDGDITKEQTRMLAVEINNSLMRNLSLEDVYLVCQQLKSSKVFGKLKPNHILHALKEHQEQKTLLVIQRNMDKHLSHKNSRTHRKRQDGKEDFNAYFEVLRKKK